MKNATICQMKRRSQITALLEQAAGGKSSAPSSLLPLVYQELRVLAESRLRRTPPGQTLQPTALVHEAYARIVGDDDAAWENRNHFFFAAARAMHDILVENARRKSALRRGGYRRPVSDFELADAFVAPAHDMIALSRHLAELESSYPRKHRVVMLSFFAGLTQSQIALALNVTERTVRHDWRFARLWLHKRLTMSEVGDEHK